MPFLQRVLALLPSFPAPPTSHASALGPAEAAKVVRFEDIPAEVWADRLVYKHLAGDVRSLTALGGLNTAMRQLVFAECADAWWYAARQTIGDPVASTVTRGPSPAASHAPWACRTSEGRALMTRCGQHFATLSALENGHRPSGTRLQEEVETIVYAPDGRSAWTIAAHGDRQTLVRTMPWTCVGAVSSPPTHGTPVWSPDANLLVLRSHLLGVAIFAVGDPLGGVRSLGFVPDARRPWVGSLAWSPDSQVLAYAQQASVRLVDTSHATREVHRRRPQDFTSRRTALEQFRATDMRWNPRGDLLACRSSHQVAIINLRGARVALLDAIGSDATQVWCNDRTLLAVSASALSTCNVDNLAEPTYQVREGWALPKMARPQVSQDGRYMAWLESESPHPACTLTLFKVDGLCVLGRYALGEVHDFVWSAKNSLAITQTVRHPLKAPAVCVSLMRPDLRGGIRTLVNEPKWGAAHVAWLGRGHGLLVTLCDKPESGGGQFETHVHVPGKKPWRLDWGMLPKQDRSHAAGTLCAVSPNGDQVIAHRRSVMGGYETILYDFARSAQASSNNRLST